MAKTKVNKKAIASTEMLAKMNAYLDKKEEKQQYPLALKILTSIVIEFSNDAAEVKALNREFSKLIDNITEKL